MVALVMAGQPCSVLAASIEQPRLQPILIGAGIVAGLFGGVSYLLGDSGTRGHDATKGALVGAATGAAIGFAISIR
jgi:uncharacterized protein YqgC (DUF456 family)